MEENNANEIEIIDEPSDEVTPYRYTITSYGADYPVDSLVKRLESEVVFVPKFQRGYVWSLTEACRFVESLLLGLPVPGIFLSKDTSTSKLLVIDGQQRLKTLQFFYEGIFKGKEFKLVNVQKRFEGKTYKTLEDPDRIRLDDAIIHATIVKQDEPSDDQSSVFHIFERLNTGGKQLQPQEIRTCIYFGKFTGLLKELNNHSSWRDIYGKPSERLKDQELILRFFALFFHDTQYETPMKEFLNKYMGENRELVKDSEEVLCKKFTVTIDFIHEVFGTRAFRPKKALNVAVFDAIMVAIAKRIDKGEITNKAAFRKRYKALLVDNSFLEACSRATTDKANVNKRILLATEAFQELA